MAPSHPSLIFGGGGIGDEFPTLESAAELLSTLKALEVKNIDTAALYPPLNIGASETYLGELGAANEGFTLNTKPLALGLEANGTLSPAAIEKSLATSYERLKLKDHKVDVYTLHVPDFTTPLKDQAASINEQYKKGLFTRLGVCNFPLPMLSEYIEICESEGYVKPTVYIGRYNILDRGIEAEKIPFLHKHGILLEAHSPSAGGFLSGSLTTGNVEGTRFAAGNIMGAHARQLYDKPELHRAIKKLDGILGPEGISKPEASLRWLSYHSQLRDIDRLIVGASNLSQLKSNVEAVRKGPLPAHIVKVIDGLLQEGS